MAYVSLYRKYRPQTFAEIVGQEHVTRTLAHALEQDRLHHAYLFTGPRGTGKTSTARILAKSLNCEHGPTVTPDNTCPQCRSITTGSSIDVIEIDAASHGGVDDVRDLRDRVAFAPASARIKVYIVDECHMLSTAGWNAFLKTLEEPPGHVMFVFATTEPHKVLDTILSRTQRFDFKRIPADQLAAHIAWVGGEEGLEFGQGAVDAIVRAGDGSARDAMSVLEQVASFTGSSITLGSVLEVLGSSPAQALESLVDAISGGDVAAVCLLVQRLADAGHDLRQFSKDAIEHLRAVFLTAVAPDANLVEGTTEWQATLAAHAGRLGRVELLRAIELLADAQAQMRRGNTRLPLEIALAKACLPESSGDPAALAARLDRMERAATAGGGDGSGASPVEGRRVPPVPDASARSEVAADRGSEPQPQPGPAPQPAPQPGPAPRPEPAPQPTPEPQPAPQPRPQPTPEPQPAPQPRPLPQPDGPPPWPGPGPGPVTPDPGEPPAPTPEPVPDPTPPGPDPSPTPVPGPGPVPSPVPGPDPEPTPMPDPVAGGGLSLALLQQRWPAILEAVNGSSKRVHALAKEGEPIEVEDGVVVLRFAHHFHAEQCSAESSQDMFGTALERVVGSRARLRCVVDDGGSPPPSVAEQETEAREAAEREAVAQAEEAERVGEVPDPDEAHRQAVALVERDLGGRVVDDAVAGGR